MDGISFPRQVLAVVFRRAPAFQPEPSQPTTFPGRVRALWRKADSPEPSQDQPGAQLPAGTLTIRVLTYQEARHIGEAYRNGEPLLVDLSQLSHGDATRIVDFAAGLVFGTRGSLSRIADRIFLLQPHPAAMAPEGDASTTSPEPLLKIASQLSDHPD
jgi:FtsZ-interacting cell division protein YlmF